MEVLCDMFALFLLIRLSDIYDTELRIVHEAGLDDVTRPKSHFHMQQKPPASFVLSVYWTDIYLCICYCLKRK